MKKIKIITVHHHWAYTELVKSIQDVLNSYGFEAYYGDELKDFESFNIFISGQNFGPPVDCINILFETDHAFLSPAKRILDYFRFTRSLTWFDYGEDLRESRNIYYCPLGYSKHFDTDIPRQDKRDTLHIGRSEPVGYGDCRHEFRTKYNLFGFPHPGGGEKIGRERDEYIVTSKVNINSKFHEKYAFVTLHAALIVNKGKLLLQEDYGLNDYGLYKPYIVLFNDKDFEEKLNYWISHDKERHDFEKFVYEEMKTKHRFEKYLYEVIGDLLGAYK